MFNHPNVTANTPVVATDATPTVPTYTIQACRNGAWETVCTDAVEAAAQATASYVARRYEVETRVVAPLSESARIWCRGGNAAVLQHLILENIKAGMICPQCSDPCGHLYRDADTPAGACLSCKIDHDLIREAEARYDAEAGADTCCCCGCD